MTDKILDISDLSISFAVYGGVLHVLSAVELGVWPGEKVGLVGETGCGKTTTAKAVLGILPKPPATIDSGHVIYDDRDVLAMRNDELRRLRADGVSMIFQDPTAALNPVLKVGTQLMDVMKHSGKFDRSISRRKLRVHAAEALESVSMPDAERVLESYPFQLSGGMRQRICIAMALVTASKLLIADEPTTSLDVTIQDQVLRLLGGLVEKGNKSAILITHSLGVIREWTDRVHVMYAGSVVEIADTSRLFSEPLHPYTKLLMDAVPRLDGEGISEGIPGRIPDYASPPQGCRFHPRCPEKMPICEEARPVFHTDACGHQVACHLYRP